jgi:ABC-type nitrate/sulfonate/bicarbonate transport system substrate-binding protein
MSAQNLRIGILRLLDSAPVLLAREYGFFAEAGLAVQVEIEPSWANIADKLAYGLLDAAVMLGPLAVAMALGLRGRRTALRFAGTLSRNGNAIVLATGDRDIKAELKTGRFAVVHAYSNHDLLLRGWLAGQGIAPGEVDILTLPPADMVDALASGTIDGFCAGAPWGSIAAWQGCGAIVARSADLAPDHPEKMMMLRGDFMDAHPMAAAALREALGAATALCVTPSSHAGLADVLAAPHNLDLPREVLAPALSASGGNPSFMTGVALRPDVADLDWTVGRMRDAGYLRDTMPEDAVAALMMPSSAPG